MSGEPPLLTSRTNPLLQRLRRLHDQPTAYRRQGELWLEGEHLCAAALSHGVAPRQAVVAESAWERPALRALAGAAPAVVRVADALFASVSALGSPGRIGFVLDAPPSPAPQAGVSTLVLDRVQDAGNVGSLLRSASALGVVQVVALEGTAALWSPKVLRAGMGAHFALRLCESAREEDLDALQVPLVATTPHGGVDLPDAPLPDPCAWVLGHEGQGVGAGLLARCRLAVRIPQPGGEESLNVAAAGAICLYESARQRIARAPPGSR